jgi:hypothetical protein
VTVTLCVLLWANGGAVDALVAYEDAVLGLLPDHDGRVLQRARTAGTGDEPVEFQLLEFASEQALDQYLNDGRRLALSDERDRAIARTETFRVELV